MTELFYTTRLQVAVLPALADDRTWTHPLMSPADQNLRTDLDRLADRIPAVLDRLSRLPQLMIHGDASPQNLLVPADRPDTFVAIDWSMGGLAAVGDDLGQLVVGLAHAGLLDATELDKLREIVIDSYADGLSAESWSYDHADIRYGMDGGLLLRSALTALPLDRLHEPPTDDLAGLFAARLALTRHLVDLGLAMPR